MGSTTTITATRTLGGVQLALGALLAARPRFVADHLDNESRTPTWLVRLLGARGIAQGAVTIAAPCRTTVTSGAAVDATHALSMLPVIVGSSRYRRPAAISAGVAALMALAGAGLGRTHGSSAT